MDTLLAKMPAEKLQPKTKTFEICFEHEPTQNDIYAIQNTFCEWQNQQVIKYSSYPHPKINKIFKFWTMTFEVDESDWLFWCGFLAGRRFGLLAINRQKWDDERERESGDYMVQI